MWARENSYRLPKRPGRSPADSIIYERVFYDKSTCPLSSIRWLDRTSKVLGKSNAGMVVRVGLLGDLVRS